MAIFSRFPRRNIKGQMYVQVPCTDKYDPRIEEVSINTEYKEDSAGNKVPVSVCTKIADRVNLHMAGDYSPAYLAAKGIV